MRTRRRNDLKPSIRGQKPRIHGLIISSPTFSALSPDSSSSLHLPSVVKTVSVTDHHASKAEDFFHKFDQMDDTSIFDALTLLLDELTFTKAQTIRKFLERIGANHQLFDFLRILSTKCAPTNCSLFSSTSADTQLKASFIKLLLSLRYINGFIRNATREAGGVDQREVDHSLIVQINMIVFLIHVLAHDPDFPSEDCMDEHEPASQPRQWENGVPNELIVGTRKRSSVQSGGGSF
ncbi:hypothetical protein HID58_057839 [Brassica napus]|uniref:Uncharacterized protein n=1 Tax=Brassica napus TaxID=3708 RepID=A0ABQ7XHN7_BRANA|nr:hypothetical protein HID58_057839 [Brassica napus]